MTSVADDWPAYLLTNIPAGLRVSLSAQAEHDDTTVADTVRKILCGHYRLECPPVSAGGYRATRDKHHPNLVLRVQPDLFRAVKADAKVQRRTMRHIIMEILTDHARRPRQAA